MVEIKQDGSVLGEDPTPSFISKEFVISNIS
jgi:hypothetical protein